MLAVVAVVAVTAATISIGALGVRVARSTSDFFVAARTVPPMWNASAISGEYLSAASFLGVAGLVMKYGVDMLWYPVGYAAGYLVLLIRTLDRHSVGLAAAAGVTLGLAALSRPAALLLPAVPLGWILFRLRARGIAIAIAFALGFVVVLLPWVIRNDRVLGKPIATTTLGGFVLLRHNAMIAEGKYHPGYSHEQFEPMVRRLALAAGRPLEAYSEAEIDGLLRAEARRIILAYPWRYAMLTARRTIWIWYNENSGRGLYAVQNFLIYLLALIGLFYALRSREPLYLLLLAHIAYFVAVHSAINVQYRFISPIMPYMIMLAGLPVLAWKTRRSKQAGPAVL